MSIPSIILYEDTPVCSSQCLLMPYNTEEFCLNHVLSDSMCAGKVEKIYLLRVHRYASCKPDT